MFLGKTLYSHRASLHPGVSIRTGKLSGKPGPMEVGNLGVILQCLGGNTGFSFTFAVYSHFLRLPKKMNLDASCSLVIKHWGSPELFLSCRHIKPK